MATQIEQQQDKILQEQVWRLMLDHISEGVAVANNEGQFILFNPAAEEIIGIGSTELPMDQWSSVFGVFREDKVTPFPTEELPVVAALHGKKTTNVIQFIRNHKRPNGVFLSVSGSPIYDKNKKIIGGVAIFRDITGQKSDHDKVTKSELLFHTLFEFAPDGIVVVDRAGFILRANYQVKGIFNYTQAELIGKPIEMLIPERYREKHVEYRNHFVKGPNIINMGRGKEIFGRKKDGSEVPVDISLGSFIIDDQIHVLAVIRNITENKKIQGQIDDLNKELTKKISELEVVNQELEAFSYSVSHDLRAPLRSMMGFSKILLEDFNKSLDAEAKDSLSRVIQASHHMGNLIDGLLKLSHVLHHKIERKQLDLTKIATDIIENLKKDFPDRTVECFVQEDIVAEGDEELLKAVLTNLLNNAWKFTAHKKDANIEFGMFFQNNEKTFFVRDNGIGFDMKYANKLFGAFQRLHSASEFEGTGIGLATVQRIIRRHGGKIWADSQPNKGTTFYFTLA